MEENPGVYDDVRPRARALHCRVQLQAPGPSPAALCVAVFQHDFVRAMSVTVSRVTVKHLVRASAWHWHGD